MGIKALIRLFIALAVIGAIAAIVHFTGTGGGVSEITSTTKKKRVFDNFPLNDVAEIVIKDKDKSLTLKKGKKLWEVSQRDGYPAKTPVVNALLKSIWNLNITQVLSIGRSQLGRLNLLDPVDKTAADGETAVVATFKDKGGKELATMWMGKVYERSENRPNPFGGGMATTPAGRYVRRGDSNAVYLVADTFKTVVTDPAEWLSDDFFKIEKIKSISIKSGNPKDDWKLVRTEENGDFSFAKKNKGELDLDPAKTSSMKSAFSNPRMEDVFVGKDAEKNKVGKTSFQITTFDGFTYNISVGEKNDLNELPLTVQVSGKFQEKRKEGEEESDEEKKKLDKEFAENLKKLHEKLANEKALEGHIFKVRSYLVDSITKKRSELLKEKKKPEAAAPGKKGTTPVAPGVNLPLPAGHPVLPKKTPAKVKAPTPKAEADATSKPVPKAAPEKPAPKAGVDSKAAPKPPAKPAQAKPPKN